MQEPRRHRTTGIDATVDISPGSDANDLDALDAAIPDVLDQRREVPSDVGIDGRR